MEFETRAIHEGQHPDPATGAIVTPIYQTSTFVQSKVGEHQGFEYSRTGIRRAPRSNRASRRWRARRTVSRSRPAWLPKTRSFGCSPPATT